MPFERYKADIDKLVQRKALLSLAMALEVYPDESKKLNVEGLKKIPKFKEAYQRHWRVYRNYYRIVEKISFPIINL